MATGTSTSSPWPANTGMLELEVAQVAVSVNYQLNAIEVEVANPAGNGAVMLFDLGAALDTCLRIVAACMRLRGLTTP